MKTWPHGVVFSLMVLLLGVGAWQFQQRAELEAWKGRALNAESEVARRRAEQTNLEKTVREGQDRLTALQIEGARAATPAASVTPKTSSSEEAFGRALGDAVGEKLEADAAKLRQWLADANDPAVMRRLNTQARNQTLRHYATLFGQLNLPAEQTEAFTKLLTDKRQAPMDVAVASLQGGSDPTNDMDAYREQIIDSRTEIEAQIHALLGAAGYAQYQSYDRNFGQTNVLTNLQTALLGTNEPLTAEQSARMTQLLQTSNATRVTAPVVNGAKEFLTPTQVQALQDLRAIQQANAQKRLQNNQILPNAPVTTAKKP